MVASNHSFSPVEVDSPILLVSCKVFGKYGVVVVSVDAGVITLRYGLVVI